MAKDTIPVCRKDEPNPYGLAATFCRCPECRERMAKSTRGVIERVHLAHGIRMDRP